MKLLLDQGLPRSTGQILRAAQVDAIHTGECSLSTASDAKIIEYAREQGRIVITLDSDFHSIMVLNNAATPSVIRVRIEGLRAEPMANLIIRVLRLCCDDLIKGALVSITEHRIRIRKIPINN